MKKPLIELEKQKCWNFEDISFDMIFMVLFVLRIGFNGHSYRHVPEKDLYIQNGNLDCN